MAAVSTDRHKIVHATLGFRGKVVLTVTGSGILSMHFTKAHSVCGIQQFAYGCHTRAPLWPYPRAVVAMYMWIGVSASVACPKAPS